LVVVEVVPPPLSSPSEVGEESIADNDGTKMANPSLVEGPPPGRPPLVVLPLLDPKSPPTSSSTGSSKAISPEGDGDPVGEATLDPLDALAEEEPITEGGAG